jgi:hypothetical protein
MTKKLAQSQDKNKKTQQNLNNKLIEAIKDNAINTVCELVSLGANINAKDEKF